MIRLARSRRIKDMMQSRATFSPPVRRFIGGRTLAEALETCRYLQTQGIAASLFFMGEYVSDHDAVRRTVAHKCDAAAALGEAGLDVHVSVDPTQIGLLQSTGILLENAVAIAEAVAKAATTKATRGVDLLMLDMEDESVVDKTLALHEELVARDLPTGLTLQAYLRRTEKDLLPLMRMPCKVRLVKGAFAAGSKIAFTSRQEISRNYLGLARLMLSVAASEVGSYPIFATHDDRLIAEVIELAEKQGHQRNAFEFEMLHGVRPTLQHELARRGYCVRAYVPFGPDWWPYAARRIGESHKNLVLLLRAGASLRERASPR